MTNLLIKVILVPQKADTDKGRLTKKGEDVLDIDEFIYFYQLLTQREELEDLFEK